ncbi:MAG: prolipoprotein diacylglyceryl transferase [Clostridiales bacterium]|nr:prolipoprotein diacylglyceryl transferase [Clostridiales bacterium]
MNLINHEEVQFPGLGLKFDIDPVAFRIGNFEVYWYGILIAAALVICIALALKQAKKNNFPDSLIYDTMLVTIPCAIIGARAYYVIFNWNIYKDNLKSIFDTRAGGLAVYGGIILSIIGLLLMCKIRKIPFASLTDYCIVYLPLGQAIGRWGNFFNQEAFGTTTTAPWGMWSRSVQSYLSRFCPELVALSPVHPTFLYESVADLIIFIILLQVRKRSTHSFVTTCSYFVLYGAVRFFIEGLRTDSLYIGTTGIRASQALSLLLLLFGLFYIAFAHTRNFEKKPFPAKLYIDESKSGKSEESADGESDGEESSDDEEESEEDAAEDKKSEEKKSEDNESDEEEKPEEESEGEEESEEKSGEESEDESEDEDEEKDSKDKKAKD